jgi:hypothetical protein
VDWAVGFKDVTSTTNARTIIAAVIPKSGAGNTLPLLFPKLPAPEPTDETERQKWLDACEKIVEEYKRNIPLLLANFNSLCCDYVARQKVQGQHLNWYIVEQFPMVPIRGYSTLIGQRTAGDIIRHEVLKLTYTANDVAAFARDQGYMGSPFIWNEEERRHSRARLDALFFLLYGLDRGAAEYVLNTFRIVREQEVESLGGYETKGLILGYMAAFAAGDVNSKVSA